jgi:fructose-bisphosphate aldolase class II
MTFWLPWEAMMAAPKYAQIGLVNTREMLKKAMEGGYAIPAYNFNNLEQLEAVIVGCVKSESPVILQCPGQCRESMNQK